MAQARKSCVLVCFFVDAGFGGLVSPFLLGFRSDPVFVFNGPFSLRLGKTDSWVESIGSTDHSIPMLIGKTHGFSHVTFQPNIPMILYHKFTIYYNIYIYIRTYIHTFIHWNMAPHLEVVKITGSPAVSCRWLHVANARRCASTTVQGAVDAHRRCIGGFLVKCDQFPTINGRSVCVGVHIYIYIYISYLAKEGALVSYLADV